MYGTDRSRMRDHAAHPPNATRPATLDHATVAHLRAGPFISAGGRHAENGIAA